MAKLSDFVPDAPIAVDRELMARNAKNAGGLVDWKATPVKICKRAASGRDPLSLCIAARLLPDDGRSNLDRTPEEYRRMVEDESDDDIPQTRFQSQTSSRRSFASDGGGAEVTSQWRDQQKKDQILRKILKTL